MRFAASVLAAAIALGAGPTEARSLTVISAAAAKDSLAPLPALAQKSIGERVDFSFGTAGQVNARASSGKPFDIAIAPPKVLAALARKGVVSNKRLDLGVVVLAAAAKAGSPKPDIATVESFKTALREAQSIGIADPKKGATSGIYLFALMGKLGLADAVKDKLKFFPDGQDAAKAAARGDISIALGQKSEFVTTPGVELVGALPQSVQLRTIYSAAQAKAVEGRKDSGALFALLSSPQIRASFAAHGFDPGGAAK